MSETTTTPKKKTLQLVYTGVDFDDKGKKFFIYLHVDESGEVTDKKASYQKKLQKHGSVGSIISIQSTEDEKSVYPGTSEWKCFYKNTDLVAKWKAMSDASEDVARNKKESKKNLLHEKLEPLRQAYRQSGYQERTQLLANIIEYVTR